MAAECLAKTTSIDNEQTRVFMPPERLTRTHAPVGLGANLVTTGRSGGVPPFVMLARVLKKKENFLSDNSDHETRF
jgi:hypothetical protein